MLKKYQLAGLIKLLISDGVPKPKEIILRTKNVSNEVGCNLTISVVYFRKAGVSKKTMSIISNSAYYCGHDSGIHVLSLLAERINSVAVVLETAESGQG